MTDRCSLCILNIYLHLFRLIPTSSNACSKWSVVALFVSKSIPVARNQGHKTCCRALPLQDLARKSISDRKDGCALFVLGYKQNRVRLQMAPCVYLNWHVGIGAGMEAGKSPEASRQCACAHVRVTACVCTGHAVTLMSISTRTCAPLFDVRLSLCLDKWAAASPMACRASDQPCLSGADTVVKAVEEDRHILPANVKQHFELPLLMWCIGSSVSRVIISQQTWHAAIFFFLFFIFFLLLILEYISDNKVQMIGRTISGTNRLPVCFPASLGI